MLRTHIGSFLKTIYASSGLLSHVFSLPIDSNHNLRVLVQFMTRENFKNNPYNACFAVFDGHGGQRAAEFARLHLADMLERHDEIETNVMGSVKQGKYSSFD